MPLENNLTLFLDRLTSRSRLSPAEQQAILALPTRTVQIEAHRDIVRLGEETETSCVIVTGIAGRFSQSANGQRQISAIHLPGDAPDLHSVVIPKVSSALTALTTTAVLRVPHSALRSLAKEFPNIAEAFWRDCVADGSMFSQWTVNLGGLDAISRIAHLLCELAVRLCAHPSNGQVSYPLRLSQTDLGEATGLTSVHVNRTLRLLREKELVTYARGEVLIPDWLALTGAAQFDARYLHLDMRERGPDLAVVA